MKKVLFVLLLCVSLLVVACSQGEEVSNEELEELSDEEFEMVMNEDSESEATLAGNAKFDPEMAKLSQLRSKVSSLSSTKEKSESATVKSSTKATKLPLECHSENGQIWFTRGEWSSRGLKDHVCVGTTSYERVCGVSGYTSRLVQRCGALGCNQATGLCNEQVQIPQNFQPDLELYPSARADMYRLRFTNAADNEYDFEVAALDSGLLILGERSDRYFINQESIPLSEGDYFALTANNQYSGVMEYESFDRLDQRVDFVDLSTGETFEENYFVSVRGYGLGNFTRFGHDFMYRVNISTGEVMVDLDGDSEFTDEYVTIYDRFATSIDIAPGSSLVNQSEPGVDVTIRTTDGDDPLLLTMIYQELNGNLGAEIEDVEVANVVEREDSIYWQLPSETWVRTETFQPHRIALMYAR